MPQYDEDEYGYGVYGTDRTPIVDSHIIDYFPSIFKRRADDGSPSVLANFVNSHEAEVRKFDADLDYVLQSRQIENAHRRDLDQIGAKFGELGKRRGRPDDEYRTYLKGVVQSFQGRGTKPGVRYAVAGAVGTDVENVVITEDFENNEYEIRIEDTEVGFLSSVVNDIAELADPAGVQLAAPPVVTLEGAEVDFDVSESTVIESASGLGSDGKDLDDTWELK